MYLIIIMNKNLILCDHDNNKINNKTEFSLKLVTNCENSIFFISCAHFTINILIDIKFSSCYASEFIPYTYLKSNLEHKTI